MSFVKYITFCSDLNDDGLKSLERSLGNDLVILTCHQSQFTPDFKQKTVGVLD